MVLRCLEFQFGVRARTLALYVLSHIVSMRSRVRSATRMLFSPHVLCILLLHAVRVFIGCVHSCYALCCVARSLCFSWVACFHVVMSCVNTWLMSILISCQFVSCFAHGGCFVLLAMCLCFCFVWAHGFCLSVPCALMSIVLTPPILFPDYWLICPTRFYLVTLLICSLHNLLVFAVLCQFIIAYIPSCSVQLGQAPVWFIPLV